MDLDDVVTKRDGEQPMSDSGESSAAAAGESPRHAVNVFIALFLLVQLLLPLRYYLGSRGSDERFSWRMFSTNWAQKSDALARGQIDIRETLQRGGRQIERTVPIQPLLPPIWIRLLGQDGPRAIESFLCWRCEEVRAEQIVLEVNFISNGESPRPPVRRTITCDDQQIRAAKASR